jgi:hypothetical protein
MQSTEFNILPPTPTHPKGPLFYFKFPDYNFTNISHLFHACYMPCLSHPQIIRKEFRLWSLLHCVLFRPTIRSSWIRTSLSAPFWCIMKSWRKPSVRELCYKNERNVTAKVRDRTVLDQTLRMRLLSDLHYWRELKKKNLLHQSSDYKNGAKKCTY